MHIGGEGLLSDRAPKETVKVQKEYIIVDQQTGEVTNQVKKLMYSVKPGARYVKEFAQNPLLRQQIPHSTRTLLSALAARLPYANSDPYISLGSDALSSIGETYGLGEASMKRGLKYLMENGYLIRMGRGRYFLNPYLYGRGTAANILERQKEWDTLQSRKKDESPA